ASVPVVLAPGETRSGVDAQMALGIRVAGHVADADGNPISGINVSVNPTGSGNGAWAQTDQDGNYLTNALVPGDYRVQFWANGPAAWAQQFWDGKSTWNTATILTLDATDAPVRGAIDAVLALAATVSGTVTDSSSQPIAGICVTAVVETPDGL